MRRIAKVTGAAVLMVAFGCESEDELASILASGGMYDTTGANVVNHDGMPPGLPLWELSETADLRIGSVEGDGPEVFGRIVDVAVTSNGHIVAADTRPLELRAFDRGGRFLWRAGREGEGPGEFKRIGKVLALPGDSLLVLEHVPPRAILFDPNGRHIRTTSLRSRDPERVGETVYRGVLSNGTVIATMAQRDGSIVRRDYRRFLHALTYMKADGSILRQGPRFFDSVRYSERIVVQQPNGPIGATVLRVPPIANQAIYAVHVDRVAVGVQARGEIIIYDSVAQPILILRLPSRGLETNHERLAEHLVESAPAGASPSIRDQGMQTAQYLPDTLPAHDRIMFDAEGRLWVEEYVPPYETRLPDWWVFDTSGRLVGRSRLPGNFVPHRIGADYVIGVTADSLGVQSIERLRISVPQIDSSLTSAVKLSGEPPSL